MKNLELNPGQRLGLVGILGAQSGNVAKLTPLVRMIELLRIGEEEGKLINLKNELQNGSLNILWDAATQPKSISLEDTDATILKNLLDSWEGFTPNDFGWLQPIMDKL